MDHLQDIANLYYGLCLVDLTFQERETVRILQEAGYVKIRGEGDNSRVERL